MSEPSFPRIYLSTPSRLDLSAFPGLLAGVLDRVEVDCLRLPLASHDEDEICRSADLVRALAHERDIPLVIDNHYRLVSKLGLDGVHLTDGTKRLRDVRKALDRDAIVGTHCGTSRHDGMTAGEIGADYVSFGPVSAQGLLGDGGQADPELFAWWSEMIEVPVVAEGGVDPDAIAALAPYVDFFCLGAEIWEHQDGPAQALADAAARIRAG